MTQALTTTNGSGVSAKTLEAVVVGGDLSKLTPEQRLEWYRNRCDAAGLDPRTQPFQYLTLQGKLSLYATKAATDQIIASRGLTVTIVDRGTVGDLYEVVCRVQFPDGHTVEDMAALPIAGLRGDALANAVMKCVTKAKRRTVLSACGLGMMDESEAESIPSARVEAVDMETGEILNAQVQQRAIESGRWQPAAPQETIAPPVDALDKAQKRLRAIVGKACKATGMDSKTGSECVKEIIREEYGKTSSKDCTPDELHRIADRIEADPKVLFAPGASAVVVKEEWPKEDDDDIPPFNPEAGDDAGGGPELAE